MTEVGKRKVHKEKTRLCEQPNGDDGTNGGQGPKLGKVGTNVRKIFSRNVKG
jgi:hypothetical protein